MKAKYVLLVFVVAAAAELPGCGHPATTLPPLASNPRSPSTLVQTGSVYEYALPSFVSNVSALANGPSDTVWFDCTTKPQRGFGPGGGYVGSVWSVCDMNAAGGDPNGRSFTAASACAIARLLHLSTNVLHDRHDRERRRLYLV